MYVAIEHTAAENERLAIELDWFGWFMLFSTTSNNISVISWQSVLFVEGNWRKPLTCRKSLSNFIT